MRPPHAPTGRTATRRGRAGRPVLVALAAAALVVGCAGNDAAPGEVTSSSSTEAPSPAPTKAAVTTAPSSAPASAGDATTQPPEPAAPAPEAVPALGVGVAPASLSIPDIEVSESIMDLGLKDDGTMQTPDDWDRVGWFTGGGRPGGRGPTVIAGHVDSPTGPAVFYRLTELEVGDRTQVTDVDGVVHDYEVYRVENFLKDDYPTAQVFGALATDELRLITCTGEFDTVSQRHEENRVVFARAVTG